MVIQKMLPITTDGSRVTAHIFRVSTVSCVIMACLWMAILTSNSSQLVNIFFQANVICNRLLRSGHWMHGLETETQNVFRTNLLLYWVPGNRGRWVHPSDETVSCMTVAADVACRWRIDRKMVRNVVGLYRPRTTHFLTIRCEISMAETMCDLPIQVQHCGHPLWSLNLVIQWWIRRGREGKPPPPAAIQTVKVRVYLLSAAYPCNSCSEALYHLEVAADWRELIGIAALRIMQPSIVCAVQHACASAPIRQTRPSLGVLSQLEFDISKTYNFCAQNCQKCSDLHKAIPRIFVERNSL